MSGPLANCKCYSPCQFPTAGSSADFLVTFSSLKVTVATDLGRNVLLMRNQLNRRNFLHHSLVLTGVATAVPTFLAGAAPAAAKRNLRKAIMWETVGLKGSVLDKCKAIKAAGFEGVEPSSHMKQDEVLQALEAAGLEAASVCCSTHWSKPVSHPDAAVREAGVEGLKQALRDAKRYGATSVLFVPGVVSKEVSYADAYTRSQEALLKALPLAAELNVKIALENVWNNFLLSPVEAKRYLDELSPQSRTIRNPSGVFPGPGVAQNVPPPSADLSPADYQLKMPLFGWHFDCGNILNYGWPEQWIRILGKRILKIHVKEFSRKKADKEGKGAGFNVKLLEGDNDWPAIMKALDEVGYTGWMIAEQDGAGTPEGMKDIAQRMDQILAS
jgi:L-ribulose-5-phosphate 3-epimerase